LKKQDEGRRRKRLADRAKSKYSQSMKNIYLYATVDRIGSSRFDINIPGNISGVYIDFLELSLNKWRDEYKYYFACLWNCWDNRYEENHYLYSFKKIYHRYLFSHPIKIEPYFWQSVHRDPVRTHVARTIARLLMQLLPRAEIDQNKHACV